MRKPVSVRASSSQTAKAISTSSRIGTWTASNSLPWPISLKPSGMSEKIDSPLPCHSSSPPMIVEAPSVKMNDVPGFCATIRPTIAPTALAGVAGVLGTSEAGAYYPSPGMGVLLSVFTAAFLGAAIAGRFDVLASVFGALYLTVVTTGLQMLGVEHWVSLFVQGMILVVAIGLARLGGASSAGPSLGSH